MLTLTHTLDLSALPEAMSPADVKAACAHLVALIGGRARVGCYVTHGDTYAPSPVLLHVSPDGLYSRQDERFFHGDTWAAVFGPAVAAFSDKAGT